MSEQVWCVHVVGPDEILPAVDRHDAMHKAHELNADYVAHIPHENPELSEFYPHIWAIPTLRSEV